MKVWERKWRSHDPSLPAVTSLNEWEIFACWFLLSRGLADGLSPPLLIRHCRALVYTAMQLYRPGKDACVFKMISERLQTIDWEDCEHRAGAVRRLATHGLVPLHDRGEAATVRRTGGAKRSRTGLN